MDLSMIVGDWDTGAHEITILAEGGHLSLRCPETPPGYEGHLVEMDEGHFRVEWGSLAGAELIFDGRGGGSLGGHRPLTRLDRPARSSAGAGLRTDEPEFSSDEAETYEHVWSWAAHPSHPPEVELAGLGLCRFLQWLMTGDRALFHGANDVALEELVPAEWPVPSVGPPEKSGVHATEDPLCSMFLSIVDRSRAGTEIRHGVERFLSADGGHVDLYQFSLPAPSLRQQPFSAGGLYILPRERFQPVPLYPGGPASREWICPEPVRPLAALIVTPEDFPFLDGIGAA
jgi:hypothetical protein